MSRGLGKTQRLVLETLAGTAADLPTEYRWVSVFEIAHAGRCDGRLDREGGAWSHTWACAECGAARPTAAESESVRRAIRKLAAAGLVEAAHFTESIGRRHEWVNRWTYSEDPTARKQLHARLPLTDDEAVDERRRREERLAALAERIRGRLGT